MAKLQLTHIKNKLSEKLTDLIDMSDYVKKSEEERKKACLSRSYAAYTLVSLASATEEEAAKAIVDGYRDNGIDAIYYEEQENILWLVQSKWIESGNGEPETGEVSKFIQGVKDVIGFKFNKFNQKIKDKQVQIEKCLNNYTVKIKICLAYSGSKLGQHNQNLLSELIDEENTSGELFFLEIFSLSEAHNALSKSFDKSINQEIRLTNWGLNEEPYQTWYGQINAEELAALWIQYKESLFSNNIRSFVGLTDVNDGIQATLLNNPEIFLYLNNGVTVLCRRIQKTAKGGYSDKSVGDFYCEGISIINGAQTVGTIGTTYASNPEKVKEAKVFLKLISLENCPPDFALKVTKSTNTQNKVENRDFISLDNLHEKLKKEFALEGISYHYKRDEHKYPSDDKNCTLDEATIALACGLEEIRYAHIAKDKLGKLWEDVSKPPYTEIFNPNVSVQKIWRMVQISRMVDNKLSHISINNDELKANCTFGNRFILHMVFHFVGMQNLFLFQNEFEKYSNDELQSIIDQVFAKTVEAINIEYPNKIVYQVFRNLEKYKVLKQKVIDIIQQKLEEQEKPENKEGEE
ncbi:AIPR family protein [Anabaena sphaerica FACHB-251]|uniref:AIPR family protein n=1 Tax=Anabaena sphaerica FACHB-251 TaxID=2692883 RepID=A0A927A3C7_9NOST|nr:AIPR family protein [Anabaena sphaerica]MBD2296016.1 AIPR family protein [Anabaena sphaerica FACHB-251]